MKNHHVGEYVCRFFPSTERPSKNLSLTYPWIPIFSSNLDHPKLPVFFFKPKGDGHIAVKFANAGRPGPSGTPVRRVMTSSGSEPEVAGNDRNFQVTDGWMDS